MASIGFGTAPSVPRGSIRDAVDWTRVIVASLARGLVITLLGMALWAAAPAVLGWHPTTVMTGSMEPRLAPGDVVVSRPVATTELRLGQVVLYDDPDQAGELRLHRVHAVRAGGLLITKGDANPQPDSTPVARSAVLGVAFIRVPYLGMPIVWLRDGEWHRVVLLGLVLTVVALLGTIDGSLRRIAGAGTGSDDADPSGGSESSGGSDGAGGSGASGGCGASGGSGASALGREARGASAPRPRVGGTRREHQRHLRTVLRLQRVGAALAVGLVVVGAGAFLPARALAATFSTTTVNPASTWAGLTVAPPTALTCTNNADKTVTISWSYSGPTPIGFDAVAGSTVLASASSPAARSLTIAGSGSLNLGTTTAVAVRTDLTSTWNATSATTVNVKTTGVLGGSLSATCA